MFDKLPVRNGISFDIEYIAAIGPKIDNIGSKRDKSRTWPSPSFCSTYLMATIMEKAP